MLVADKGLAQAQADTFCEQLRGVADDDLWHLAAAIAAGRRPLVTNNTADFTGATIPADLAAPRIVTPDEFMMGFVSEGLAEDLAATAERMTGRLDRPPMSTDEMLALLRRDGLPRTAAAPATEFDPTAPHSPAERTEPS